MKALAKKMLKIMEKVKYLEKKGFNDFQKYKYATEAEVSKAFSSALVECGVALFISQEEYNREVINTTGKGGQRTSLFVSIKIKLTLVDVDSGETHESYHYGDGIDSGDKALYKGITGCIKYALMKTFLVETGDDPENESQQIHAKDESSFVDIKQKAKYISLLEKASEGGMDSFRDTWMDLPKNARDAIGGDEEFISRMKVRVAQVDFDKKKDEDIPQ